MIFQALGSTNNFLESLRHFFAYGTKKHSRQLVATLEDMYQGKAFLYAKGRYALADAIQASRADKVALNGFTCSVVVDAVLAAKAAPVFLDIDATYHFSATTLEKALKDNPTITTVVVQNTFGQPCDIERIEKITRRHHCLLVEDLAHSIGTTYSDGRQAGTVGDLVMLSFGRDKVVDVVNGGALIVRNESLLPHITQPSNFTGRLDQLRDRIYPLLSHAIRTTYRIGLGKVLLAVAYKTRLAVRSADGTINTKLQLEHWKSRLVLQKLKNLQTTIARRQEIAALYSAELPEGLSLLAGPHRAALQVPNQKTALSTLRAQGYMLDDTWYDTPIGPARKYSSYNYPADTNPVAVTTAAHVINLPTHQYVSKNDARAICRTVKGLL